MKSLFVILLSLFSLSFNLQAQETKVLEVPVIATTLPQFNPEFHQFVPPKQDSPEFTKRCIHYDLSDAQYLAIIDEIEYPMSKGLLSQIPLNWYSHISIAIIVSKPKIYFEFKKRRKKAVLKLIAALAKSDDQGSN